MAARKRRRKPGVLWRVVFGYNGPTKGALKKAWTQTFSKTFPIKERDAVTGHVRTRYMRVEKDGRVVEVKAPAKKKRAPAKKPTAKRGASQPSKPSRASKGGTTPRRTAAPVAPAGRRTKATPLADRVLRNPDGTLAGSKPASPEQQLRKAEAEYRKALRNAATAGRRADELLGWKTPRR